VKTRSKAIYHHGTCRRCHGEGDVTNITAHLVLYPHHRYETQQTGRSRAIWGGFFAFWGLKSENMSLYCNCAILCPLYQHLAKGGEP
jgi:hypothetical protein